MNPGHPMIRILVRALLVGSAALAAAGQTPVNVLW